jgi:hypothetical protein
MIYDHCNHGDEILKQFATIVNQKRIKQLQKRKKLTLQLLVREKENEACKA